VQRLSKTSLPWAASPSVVACGAAGSRVGSARVSFGGPSAQELLVGGVIAASQWMRRYWGSACFGPGLLDNFGFEGLLLVGE